MKILKKGIVLALIAMVAVTSVFTVNTYAKSYPRAKLIKVGVVHSSKTKATIIATAAKPASKCSHYIFTFCDKSTRKQYTRVSNSNRCEFKVNRASKNHKWSVTVNVSYDKYARKVSPGSKTKTVSVKKRIK